LSLHLLEKHCDLRPTKEPREVEIVIFSPLIVSGRGEGEFGHHQLTEVTHVEQGFFLVPQGVGDVFTHGGIFEVGDCFVQELEFVGEPV
jgi:hypothetical protein